MTKAKVSKLDQAVDTLACLRNDLRCKWANAQNDAVRDLIMESEHEVSRALQILTKERQRNLDRLRGIRGRVA